MDTLVKADIFFFISGIGVIISVAALVFIAYYMVKTLKEIRSLTRRAHDELDNLSDEISEMKQTISDRVTVATRFLGVITSANFIKKIFAEKSNKKKRNVD